MSLIDWHGDPTARFDAAQRFVDSEVLRRCTPYVPMDTGELIYKTPYARRWYHEPARFDGRPMRGNYWFERMLQSGGRDAIKRGIAQILARQR